jgi:hypothetical protein
VTAKSNSKIADGDFRNVTSLSRRLRYYERARYSAIERSKLGLGACGNLCQMRVGQLVRRFRRSGKRTSADAIGSFALVTPLLAICYLEMLSLRGTRVGLLPKRMQRGYLMRAAHALIADLLSNGAALCRGFTILPAHQRLRRYRLRHVVAEWRW